MSLSEKLNHVDKYIGELATRYTIAFLKPYDVAKSQATDLKRLMHALEQEHNTYQSLYKDHNRAVVYMENKEIVSNVLRAGEFTGYSRVRSVIDKVLKSNTEATLVDHIKNNNIAFSKLTTNLKAHFGVKEDTYNHQAAKPRP